MDDEKTSKLENSLKEEILKISKVREDFKQHPEELLPKIFAKYYSIKAEMQKLNVWDSKYDKAFEKAKESHPNSIIY